MIALAGTTFVDDVINSSKVIWSTKIPSQYGDAQRLYEQVKKYNLDKDGLEQLIPGRVYTNEEIGKMSSAEFSKAENHINEQLRNGRNYNNAQAEQQVLRGGLIYVQAYTLLLWVFRLYSLTLKPQHPTSP